MGLRAEIRELLVANLFDGDEGGTTTWSIPILVDEVSELIATWLIDGVEEYYGGESNIL